MMAWAKLDDKFHSHPTTWIVGLEANGLFCRGISYCADQLTDGFIPEAWVYAQVPSTRANRDAHGLIDKLVNAGLWERIEDGWRIPGYLEFNPPKDQVLAEREAQRDLSAKGGKARWADMDADQRSEAARQAAVARWAKKRAA